MLAYETALKLKEAGFPQILNVGSWWYKNDTDAAFVAIIPQLALDEYEKYIFIPTLSELIEACGNEFDSLERYSGGDRWRCVKWVTHIFQCKDGVDRKGCLWEGENWGFSPEEAVANLWFELNKK